MYCCILVFFFKHKTADVMRISDWSSDVCSSDLAGGYLLGQAIRAGADVFVTADYKYHEFFDAEGKIVIADVGHFESEQFTQQLLLEIIQKNGRASWREIVCQYV